MSMCVRACAYCICTKLYYLSTIFCQQQHMFGGRRHLTYPACLPTLIGRARYARVRAYRAWDTYDGVLSAASTRHPSIQSIFIYVSGLATLTGEMCSTSQCELRSTFPNLRVNSGMLNVIRIVAYYTLPPLESPDSFWIAMAFSRYRPRPMLSAFRFFPYYILAIM